MDTDEDTDSEEEVNDLMREAANCDYVNNLYSNNYTIQPKVSKVKRAAEAENQEETALSSHQIYLSKVLSKKLDDTIEIEEVHELPCLSRCKPVSIGIQLLKDSILIDEPVEEILIQKKYCGHKNRISEKELILRAQEAAVTPDWILSKSDTAFWRFYKPKVIYAKVENKVDDKIVCSITSKTF